MNKLGLKKGRRRRRKKKQRSGETREKKAITILPFTRGESLKENKLKN